jgi:multiple sugar transport system substrate-binding protein
MDSKPVFAQPMKRRTFLGGTAAAAAALSLGINKSWAQSGEKIKFWDMVWGTGQTYTDAAKGIADSYNAADGLLNVEYQSIPWGSWYQTFTAAGAANTTPAVSSGAAYLPFYFMEEGKMAPADDLLATLDKEGKNDFLPGLIDALRTKDGLAAVPWSIDLRVLWYRKSILEKAGADVPTDWQSFIKTGEALQKAGYVGFATSGYGFHGIASVLLNNGGGLFNEDGEPDCVIDRNIESLDFLHELVAKQIIDPYAIGYDYGANVVPDWASGHIAMGFEQVGLPGKMPADVAADLVVASPIASDNGSKGAAYWVNPLMMFKTTASQQSSEAFLAHYLDNLHLFWEQGLNSDLPVKKSITDLPMFQNDPNLARSINEWQPVGKTIAARSKYPFGALNAVDGGSAMINMLQKILQGESNSKALLEELQTGLITVLHP